MSPQHYAELLSAGPEFTAEEVPEFLRTFRPRLTPVARAVHLAMLRWRERL